MKCKKRVTLSIDFGNSFIKGATYSGEGLKKKKLPNKIQHSQTLNPKVKKFERDGVPIYIGVGEMNNNILKHKRKNLLEQALVMIDELYPDEQNLEVSLKTGLPPVQLFNKTYNNEFKEIFSNKGEIEYSVNGKIKVVNIVDIEIFAEGHSAFVSVVDDIVTKQDILSIDVGGGTTDVCSYVYDYEDSVFHPDKADTIEKGIIDFSEEIANHFNNENGADVKPEQIDIILRNNLSVIDYEDKEYNLEDYIGIIESTCSMMINKITNNFGQLDRYAIVGLGGGYKTFNRIVKERIAKQIDFDSEIQFYANALGYLEQ